MPDNVIDMNPPLMAREIHRRVAAAEKKAACRHKWEGGLLYMTDDWATGDYIYPYHWYLCAKCGAGRYPE